MVLIDQLKQTNADIASTLDKLIELPFEDDSSDTLIEQVQELVNSRQELLSQLISTEKNAEVLRNQLDVGRNLEEKAQHIREYRKNLMVAKSKKKRQLKIYNAIDANR